MPPPVPVPTTTPAPRRRGLFRRRTPVGASPGTLVADPTAPKPILRVIAWGPAGLLDEPVTDVAALAALRQRYAVLWVDVAGLGDVGVLQQLGALFGLHRLALEDVVNLGQRPKAEAYAEHEFVVLRMVNPGEQLDTEQFSLFLGDGFVVTFQERLGDCFDPIRTRLRDANGRLRTHGADYLAYALLDAVVDAFFPVMERVGDRLEAAEEKVLGSSEQRAVLPEVHALRRDLLALRRAVWPLREMTAALMRGDSGRFQPDTRVYLRDVHDHVVQVIDMLENFRELGAALMELWLSTVSYRLNEVMKVLTVIATIFIPLTFVAGVYGMNFKHMPELEWENGYYYCVALMAAMGLAMVWWFRRRHWL